MPAKVLVVDDDVDLVDLVEVYLSDAGYSVSRAASGEKALEVALAELPDVILLDVLLPGMDGFATAAALREHEPLADTPIVFVTALGDAALQRMAEIETSELLYKPIEPHDLQIRVKALSTTARLKRELTSCMQTIAVQSNALSVARKRREDLVHFVMHDLRSPLTVVRANATFVRDMDDLPEDARGCLDDIDETITGMLEMVRAALDVQIAGDGALVAARHEIDLADLTASMMRTLTPLARGRNVEIETELPNALPFVGDRELLTRLLANLVDNAIRHAPAHTKVRISATREADTVTIVVCDEGPGVPVSERDRVFDKFERLELVRSPRSGRGLGLAFCRVAVEAHGGTIGVDDNEPRGARFIVRLPQPTAKYERV